MWLVMRYLESPNIITYVVNTVNRSKKLDLKVLSLSDQSINPEGKVRGQMLI